MRWSSRTWEQWLELPYDERVMTVAHYRIEQLIELHYLLERQSAIEAQNRGL